MAYDPQNPARQLVSTMMGSYSEWVYESTDDTATVTAANYFANGKQVGMKVGDKVTIVDRSGDNPPVVCGVTAVNPAGEATIATL